MCARFFGIGVFQEGPWVENMRASLSIETDAIAASAGSLKLIQSVPLTGLLLSETEFLAVHDYA